MSAFSDPERLQRHRAFSKMEPTDRPLVGNFLFGYFMHEQYPHLVKAIPEGPITPDDINVDLFLQDCERLYQAYVELDDDYPFVGGPFYGVPWMEAIMGGQIISSPTSMWVEPVIEDWNAWHRKHPSLESNRWAQKLLELMEAVVTHSNGRYPVGPTLMRGPGDILSALRGPDVLPLEYYDRPEEVKRAAQLCADVWIEVGMAQLALMPTSSTGNMVGCSGLRVWAPDKVIWLQEDVLSLTSPRFYRELYLPEDRRIAKEFPWLAFHIHGTVLWALDDLLSVPEVYALQTSYEPLVDLEDAFPYWKKIQGQKPTVLWIDYRRPGFWSTVDRILNEIPPAGLSIQTTVPTLEDALKVKAYLLKK